MISKRALSANSSPNALVQAVRRALAERADPSKAPAMQAYMKSAMPYLGVPVPAMRAVCRETFALHPLEGLDDWRAAILDLWRDATHREQRYAAIELAGSRRYRAFQVLQVLPMYEEMIVTGAWWDYVDAIASHQIGDLLRLYPEPVKKKMRHWSRSRDIWKRRSAILSQLAHKKDTDLALLYDCIEPSIAEKEFFLRKAIGWALREYAKTDASEVRRYVRQNRDRLSPLSQREALKNL